MEEGANEEIVKLWNALVRPVVSDHTLGVKRFAASEAKGAWCLSGWAELMVEGFAYNDIDFGMRLRLVFGGCN
jgi:hypothetical protein